MLTVGIINFNAAEYLRACLRSVLSETKSLRAEVIVVDNDSSDSSAELVRREFPEVRIIEMETNRGYAAGCNRAFREAQGDLFLLLNPDVEVHPGCLRGLTAFLDSHPRAGIVGPTLLNTDGTVQASCGSFPTTAGYFFEATGLYRLFPTNRRIGGYHLGYLDYGKENRVDVLLGAFLLIRGEVYETLGGMDEGFFMYSEETDLCRRARDEGWESWYTPTGSATHHGGKSTEPRAISMFIENHRSKIRYMKIHGSTGTALAAKAILLFGVFIRAVAWSALTLVEALVRRRRTGRSARRAVLFWRTVAWHLGLSR